MFNRVSIPELSIVTFILWMLMDKIPTALLLIAIVLMGYLFGRPFQAFEKKSDSVSKTKHKILWMDWLGLTLIACVAYAIAQGISLGNVLDMVIDAVGWRIP